MIPVLSRAQIRALDAYAIGHGVPGLVLMENAGRGAAEAIVRAYPERVRRTVVVSGPGNNGGDGFVVARRLLSLGYKPRVFLAAKAAGLRGDAQVNYAAFTGCGGAVTELDAAGAAAELDQALSDATLVVDALLGTGLDREVRDTVRGLIEHMNAVSAPVVALDIPSGLDANTGAVLGAAVRAALTLTFAHLKLGLLTSQGAEVAGRVEVADIGIPSALSDAVGVSACVVETRDVAALIKPRALGTHKGAAGRVLAFAGSAGKTGAALLVGRGALRAGAGLVTLATFPEAADALDLRVLEAMTARIDRRRLPASLDAHLTPETVVVIGPGFGLTDDARAVVEHVVEHHVGPLVVDADAVTVLAGKGALVARAKGPRVLTPHPGEMGRLLGISTQEVEADRFSALDRAVRETEAVVVLKGARTLVGGPNRLPVVDTMGGPVLATAGSGDVLSGITAALLATVADPFEAAYAAVHVHALSGQAFARETGSDRGLLAHEIADRVPTVLAGLSGASGLLTL